MRRRLGGSTLLVLVAFAPWPAAALAQDGTGDRSWLECTGEARPPVEARPSQYQPLPRVHLHFDSLAVAGALKQEAGLHPEGGCALFLVRWSRELRLESHGVLESSLPPEATARIEQALLDGQRPRGNQTLFFRVLVRFSPEVEVAMGLPWETPPSLENPDEMDDLLASIFLEGVSRRNAQLQFRIAEDGAPADWILTRSTGHPRVDQHLQFVLPRFRFRAARVEGRPYERWWLMTLTLPPRG